MPRADHRGATRPTRWWPPSWCRTWFATAMAEGTDLDASGRLPGPHGALVHRLAGALGPQRPRAGGAAGPVRAAGRHPVSGPPPERPSARAGPATAVLPPPRAAGLGAVRALRPTHLHRLHGAGARRLAVPGLHHRGRQALASRPGVHPHQPRPHGRRRHPPTRRRSSSRSSPSMWSCSSSRTSGTTCVRRALRHGPDLRAPHDQYYRVFTAMWLHADFVHIFFNMITLLIVGPAVEVLLGKIRFLALYLIAGLGGSVGSYLLGPHNGRARRVGRDHRGHGRPMSSSAATAPADRARSSAYRHELPDRLQRQHRLACPPGWAGHGAALAWLYDYAGHCGTGGGRWP